MVGGSMFFFQAEDVIRDRVRSRGLGDVYKRQVHASRRDPGAGRTGGTDERLLRGDVRRGRSVRGGRYRRRRRFHDGHMGGVETLSLIHISEPTRPY